MFGCATKTGGFPAIVEPHLAQWLTGHTALLPTSPQMPSLLALSQGTLLRYFTGAESTAMGIVLLLLLPNLGEVAV